MVKVLSIIAGMMLFSVFAVLFIGGCNSNGQCSGVYEINEQYGQEVASQYQLEIDDGILEDQRALSNDISNSNPGGEGGSNLISGATEGAVLALKSFASIFDTTNKLKTVIEGKDADDNSTGLANQVGIDPKITQTFMALIVLTVGIILIQAFLKNKLET